MAFDEVEAAKRASLVEAWFRTARRLNEVALARVREATGQALRPSHTALFPHLDARGVRATALARKVGVSKQAIGPLVDELEAMGVVERVADPADGRAKLVRFAGQDALLAGLQVLMGVEADLARILGDEDMAVLRRVMPRVIAALDAGEFGDVSG